MCGRYTQTSSVETLQARFGFEFDPDEPGLPEATRARYNVAPGQYAPVILADGPRRLLRVMQWGLVPAAFLPRSNRPMINARAETVHEKPTFRDAFRHRRCLVPADGFYEWPQGSDYPFHISVGDRETVAFAGIWERKPYPGGADVESFAILTIAASPAIARIHERMPVYLRPEDEAAWLDPVANVDTLRGLLHAREDGFTTLRVGSLVNTTKYDSPECLRPEQMLFPE